MEVDPQTLHHVWWKGAISGALKGIPQGLLLGAIGFGILVGGIYALGATGVAASFGTFLFGPGVMTATMSQLPAFSLALLNPIPFIALNTVLTSVGNFLTGGKIACNAYKQDVEHRMNETRIGQLESRSVAPSVAPSRVAQTIIAQGPRAQRSFAGAELARSETSDAPTLH